MDDDWEIVTEWSVASSPKSAKSSAADYSLVEPSGRTGSQLHDNAPNKPSVPAVHTESAVSQQQDPGNNSGQAPARQISVAEHRWNSTAQSSVEAGGDDIAPCLVHVKLQILGSSVKLNLSEPQPSAPATPALRDNTDVQLVDISSTALQPATPPSVLPVYRTCLTHAELIILSKPSHKFRQSNARRNVFLPIPMSLMALAVNRLFPGLLCLVAVHHVFASTKTPQSFTC